MQKLERIAKEDIINIKENNLYVSLKTGEVRSEPFKESKTYNEDLLKDVHNLYLEGNFYPGDLFKHFNLPKPNSILNLFRKRKWKTLNSKEVREVYGEEILSKFKSTCIINMGVENPMQSEEVLKKFR